MLVDSLNRPIRDLRISVTDRCNYRCSYCMPGEGYEWIERSEILSFEEIAALARIFVRLGAAKIRITGGEPLLRRDLERLVEQLSEIPGIRDICVTTNGSLLARLAGRLAAAGLRRVNVSLDSLDPERFRRITQNGELRHVLDGLFAARRAGLGPVKLNTVVVRGVNDDEVLDMVDFARSHGFSLRFIEYMDAGNATDWQTRKLVPQAEILARIHQKFPLIEASGAEASAPATAYEFADGAGSIGIIPSVSAPFCRGCNRARLTADGHLVTCLFSDRGHDLKGLLRGGAGEERIAGFIESVWFCRSDRYSEERFAAMNSDEGYQAAARRKIEMIRLGG